MAFRPFPKTPHKGVTNPAFRSVAQPVPNDERNTSFQRHSYNFKTKTWYSYQLPSSQWHVNAIFEGAARDLYKTGAYDDDDMQGIEKCTKSPDEPDSAPGSPEPGSPLVCSEEVDKSDKSDNSDGSGMEELFGGMFSSPLSDTERQPVAESVGPDEFQQILQGIIPGEKLRPIKEENSTVFPNQ